MNYSRPFLKAKSWYFITFAMMIFCGLLISQESFATEEIYAVNASEVSLKAKYVELNMQLLNNQFSRPLFLKAVSGVGFE